MDSVHNGSEFEGSSVASHPIQKQSLATDQLQEYDKMFKIILIGQAATGKTSIINRFVD